MILGANYLGDRRCEFTVWAPLRHEITLEILSPQPQHLAMTKDEWGYWRAIATDVPPGALYQYRLDDEISRPDPASQSQPQDVHKPSQVVDHRAFGWSDGDWSNHLFETYLIYELHVGTFTPEGTFSAIIPRLAQLRDLGITAIELMPVAQFPGDRNWGYDGVYPFAVQHSYGGVDGLKALVDACHRQGLAVILDVVYNHFGPEGNYTQDFGPYFTDRYRTPWGRAINYDDAYSYGVREFVLENALYWFRDFHIDALRLDAIHAIYDFGGKHILAEMAERVADLSVEQGRPFYLIAESDLNDGRVIRPPTQGGYGMDAQWSDDFHHALHTLLTGEQDGYYLDFGTLEQFAKIWTHSFAYAWTYSPHRKRFHGNDVSDRPLSQFVVSAQNHDQIGNRMLGERLSHLVSFEALKLAAGALILAPAIPMLFMGEEYGEEAPFLYFISHGDADLVQAVRDGRKREFAAFHLHGDPPDAASLETFKASTLNWAERTADHHGVLLEFYKALIQLRLRLAPLTQFDRKTVDVRFSEGDRTLGIRRWTDGEEALILMNLNHQATPVMVEASNFWQKQLDSAAPQWQGPGCTLPDSLTEKDSVTMQPLSVAVYLAQKS